MNKLILSFLFLFSFLAFSQKSTILILKDNQTKETIDLSEVKIENAEFSIDTSLHLIQLNKVKGSWLNIYTKNYEYFSEKDKWKKFKYDTITRYLEPKENLIQQRKEKLFDTITPIVNTSLFANENELIDHFNSYVYCIRSFADNYEPSLCSYDNNFVFEVIFQNKNGVYHLTEIKRKQPIGVKSAEINQFIILLQRVYPKFKLSGQSRLEWLSLNFNLALEI